MATDEWSTSTEFTVKNPVDYEHVGGVLAFREGIAPTIFPGKDFVVFKVDTEDADAVRRTLTEFGLETLSERKVNLF